MIDENGTARCNDCGVEYSTLGLDLVLPYEQWRIICPEDGILCANCICKRAAKNPESTVIHAWVDRMDYSINDSAHARSDMTNPAAGPWQTGEPPRDQSS